MTETRDRAEQAFGDAFDAHAADVDFAPIDPAALRATPGAPLDRDAARRRFWVPFAAAAAVLAVAVPVGSLLTQRGAQTASSGVPASRQESQAVTGPVNDSSAGSGGAGGSAGHAALQPGFRWASMLDVAVQVPRAWGYDRALGLDWCANSGGTKRLPSDPAQPFVDVRPEGRATLAILCPGDVPSARQTMHLTWRHSGSAEPSSGFETADGWVRVSREVGSAVLTVVAPLDQRGLAEQVLASAQRVEIDPLGCPTVAPVRPGNADARPAGSLTVGASVTGNGAVLCQYDDLTRATANLVGSRALDAAAATSLLRTMADPGPPTGRKPGQCVQNDRDATLAVLRVPDVGEVWVRVPGCDESSVVDATGSRAASTQTCATVFLPPLALPDGFAAGDACTAARLVGASPAPKR